MFLQPLSAELSCCCTVWHSSASVPPPTSLRLFDPGRPLACGLPPARTPTSLALRESSASLPVVQCPLVSCSFLVSHREKENLIPENPSGDKVKLSFGGQCKAWCISSLWLLEPTTTNSGVQTTDGDSLTGPKPESDVKVLAEPHSPRRL